MIRINLLIFSLIFVADLLFANQIIFDKSELNNDFKKSKIYFRNWRNQKSNFLNLFNQKNYKDIENFFFILSQPKIQIL